MALAIFTTLCLSPIFATYATQSFSANGHWIAVSEPVGPSWTKNGNIYQNISGSFSFTGGISGTAFCLVATFVVHPNGIGTASNYSCLFAGTIKGVKGLGSAVFTVSIRENLTTLADRGFWTWSSGTGSLKGIHGITTFRGTSPSLVSPINYGTYASELHF